jgi:hypothetical protein
VQRKNTELSFQLASLRLYLVATLTGMKKAVFSELRLKVSEMKLVLKIKFRQVTDGAHMFLHKEEM